MLKSKHQYSDSSFGKSVRIAHSARVPSPKRTNARVDDRVPTEPTNRYCVGAQLKVWVPCPELDGI